MPQDISGLTQAAQRLGQTFTNLANKIPSWSQKPDTTWHSQQVKAANDSFRKPATKPPTPVKPAPKPMAKPPSFKKGGTVQKTGLAKVHKGEKILTKAQVKTKKK
jgi:hypothetical protein